MHQVPNPSTRQKTDTANTTRTDMTDTDVEFWFNTSQNIVIDFVNLQNWLNNLIKVDWRTDIHVRCNTNGYPLMVAIKDLINRAKKKLKLGERMFYQNSHRRFRHYCNNTGPPRHIQPSFLVPTEKQIYNKTKFLKKTLCTMIITENIKIEVHPHLRTLQSLPDSEDCPSIST